MKPSKPIFSPIKRESVLVPVLCNCSYSPRSHLPHGDNNAPWNWEKTHKTWEQEKLQRKTRVEVVNGELTVIK